MQVRLYATLRQIAQARLIELPVEGKQTVGDVLRALVARCPELSDAVWHTDGSLSGHIAVILNGRDVRHLAGVEPSLSDDDQLDVFPPVAGGGDQPPGGGQPRGGVRYPDRPGLLEGQADRAADRGGAHAER